MAPRRSPLVPCTCASSRPHHTTGAVGMIPVHIDRLLSLIRNGLCVIKDVAPEDHYSMVAQYDVSSYAEARASQLEIIIGILQALAAITFALGGLRSLYNGVKGVLGVASWAKALKKGMNKAAKDVGEDAVKMTALALFDLRSASQRQLVAGMCDLCVSVGFVVLSLFTFHILGEHPVQWSLAAMEVALALLLWIGFSAVFRSICTARRLRQRKDFKESPSLEELQMLDSLVLAEDAPTTDEEVTAAVAKLEDARKGMAKNVKLEEAHALARTALIQAAVDIVILLLNVVAFFGYGILPVVYFFPDALPVPLLQYPWPDWWIGHDNAAWWGNIAGDVAWTLEPAILLFVAPLLVPSRKLAKPKAD
jgi:hypothetical protein